MSKISKPAFYILSIFWGFPLTLLGALVALALIVTGHKPQKWHHAYYFTVGKSWGGFNMGMFFLTDKSNRLSTCIHEFGHAIQNCFFGPMTPILVTIPSAIRYWYREYRTHKGDRNLPAYDSIWFEGQASKLGAEYYARQLTEAND